jgi:hypothetical protein
MLPMRQHICKRALLEVAHENSDLLLFYPSPTFQPINSDVYLF